MKTITPPATCSETVHDGPVLLEKSGYSVIDCAACGFIHCLPLPALDVLRREYETEYYASVNPEYISRVEQDRGWHETTHEGRLDVLESLTDGRRLLEIGSGPGLFLECARRRGWDVLGLEPSRQAFAHASQVLHLPVRNEFFTVESAASLGMFDAVYLGLVLEHVPDPAGLLAQVKNVLEPGGVLCVAVPNDFSPLQRYLVEERAFPAWWAVPPHHINYFTHASLASLLTRLGYGVVERTATFPMELFLLMGLDYTEDEVLGRRCHALRMRFEKELRDAGLDALRRDLYALLTRHGVGREAVVYARNTV